MTDDWDELGFPAPQPRVYHDPEPIFPRLVREERRDEVRAGGAKWKAANRAACREYDARRYLTWKTRVLAYRWFTKTTAFPRFRKKR